MSPKKNSCWSCLGKFIASLCKWLFGKSSGTFLLGIGTVIAAWQVSPVLEKITKVEEILEKLENSNKEINETVRSLKAESINNTSVSTVEKFTQETQHTQDPREKEHILKKTLETELSAATKSERPWGMYIKDEKIEELAKKFSQKPSNLTSFKNELLQSIETSSDSPKQNSK